MTTAWLVTGAGGQLGHDLLDALEGGPDVVTAAARAELDLTDEGSVRSFLRSWLASTDADPGVVVNAAAYTAVDAAEADEHTASLVNGLAPGWIAEELAGQARLVHVSTDYVFDGTAREPYPVDAPTAPRSAYGRTKLAGERAVAAAGGDATVVRTAWVHGRHGKNFVATMIRLERELDTVSVVEDQIGSPTWSADLAQGLLQAGRATDLPPVLHCTNSGATSWYGLARVVFDCVGADPARVTPTTSDNYVTAAPRPAYSVLDDASWRSCGLPHMRPWEEAVRLAVPQM